MSIQSELTRLTNAKAAIQAAIEGKGVTVPSGTLLDGMASLIESIEAGVGSSGTKLEISTITPSEKIYESNKLTVTHGLGAIPKFVAVMTIDTINKASFGVQFSAIYLPNRYSIGTTNLIYSVGAFYGNSYWDVGSYEFNGFAFSEANIYVNSYSPVSSMTDNSIELCGIYTNSMAGLLAGKTYFLFIGG